MPLWRRLTHSYDRGEALVKFSALEAHGFRVRFADFNTATFAPHLTLNEGLNVIQVMEGDYEDALAFLDEVPPEPETDISDMPCPKCGAVGSARAAGFLSFLGAAVAMLAGAFAPVSKRLRLCHSCGNEWRPFPNHLKDLDAD